MNMTLKEKTKALLAGQKVWVIVIAILVSMFIYGEATSTRLFAGTKTENWKPEGTGPHSGSGHGRWGGSHSNSIHHK